jgi:hypothetical protein
MEQKLRFGLVLGRLAHTIRKCKKMAGQNNAWTVKIGEGSGPW